MEREEMREAATPSTPRGEMFQEGARLEAKDHMGERWWEAKVLEVDTEGSEVLVHFAGWNGRHDEWIKMDSPRLQPFTRRSSRRRQSTGDNSGPEGSLSPRSGLLPPIPLYSCGEEVMALWQNGRKYPAVVQRMEGDGAVSVQFYDGFVKSVRPINVRRLLASDQPFVMDCKDQIVTNGSSPSSPHLPTSPEHSSSSSATSTPGPSKAKRERKTKFSVREVLNLKESSPRASKLPSLPLKPSTSDPPASTLDVTREPYERSDKVFDKAEEEENKEEEEEEEAMKGDIEVVDLSESFEGRGEAWRSETGSEGTSEGAPSEKENISDGGTVVQSRPKVGGQGAPRLGGQGPKVGGPAKQRVGGQGRTVANGNTNGVSEVRGKRARKRKRFADEEEEGEGLGAKHHRSSTPRTPSTPSSAPRTPSNPSSAPRTPSTPRTLSSTPRGLKAAVGKVVDLKVLQGKAEAKALLGKVGEVKEANEGKAEAKALLGKVGEVKEGKILAKEEGKVGPKAEGKEGKILAKRNSDLSKKRPRDKSRSLGEEKEEQVGKEEQVVGKEQRVGNGRAEDKEVETVVAPQNNNSTNGTSSSHVSPSSSPSPSYLSFDFTLPPAELLARLQEGVTIPGTSTPLTMASPKLPTGWTKKVLLRAVAPPLQVPRWEVTIESPEGRSFRSRQELSRHFEEVEEQEHNLDMFDFNLDTPLKKLRQIWKAKLPLTAPSSSPFSFPSPSLAPSSPSPAPSSPSPCLTPDAKRKPLRLPPSESERSKLEITMRVGPLSPGTPAIGNVSETGQGVRCPLTNCNKLFRNEKLLLQHVKHYHPEYTGAMGTSSSSTPSSPSSSTYTPSTPSTPTPTPSTPHRTKVREEVGEVAATESPKRVEEVVVQEQPPPTAAVVEEVAEVQPPPPPKRLSVDVRKLELGSCPPLPSPAPPPRPQRLRTDSLVSVGEEETATPPPSPPPAPSYKLSRRRAHHLRSAPATPGGSPPAEVQQVQTMEEDEVVNCMCRHPEGDGMMVQCEVCLTWQHGACIGVESEDQVPVHYICGTCRSPPLGRRSQLYCIDHEWIREGRLPSLLPPSSATATSTSASATATREQALKQLSSLMADLVSLSSILHSLQVKLAVAAQKSNPKVFMWSSQWASSSSSSSLHPSDSLEQEGPEADLFPPDMESLLGGVEEEEGAREGEQEEERVRGEERNEEATWEGKQKAERRAPRPTSPDTGDTSPPPRPPPHVRNPSSTSPPPELSQVSSSHPPELSQASSSPPPELALANPEGGSSQDSPPGPELCLAAERATEELGPKLSKGPSSEPASSRPPGHESSWTPGLQGSEHESSRTHGLTSEQESSQQVGSRVPEQESSCPRELSSEQESSRVPEQESSNLSSEQGISRGPELTAELASLFAGSLSSVSELQLLLPGVIQDMTGGGFPQQAVRGPHPALIPEPKRLDRQECRLNLLHHIEDLQEVVDSRLQEIEERLELLETSSDPSTTSASASPATASSATAATAATSTSLCRLLQDLRSAMKLNSSLPNGR